MHEAKASSVVKLAELVGGRRVEAALTHLGIRHLHRPLINVVLAEVAPCHVSKEVVIVPRLMQALPRVLRARQDILEAHREKQHQDQSDLQQPVSSITRSRSTLTCPS